MQKASLPGLFIVALIFSSLMGCASQAVKTEQPITPPAATAESADQELTAEEELLFGDDDDAWEDEDYQEMVLVADPIEPFNRAMFYFNDKLYTWVLRPVTIGYRTVAPEPVRVGVSNFFTNLTTPIRFVNCLLQGKGKAATAEVSKLIFNSTFGLLGFIDLFEDYPEFQHDKEDFGQTLGTYGIGDGFYIVWPVLGASTLRDTVGLVGDNFLNPITYMDNSEAALAIRAYDRINAISFRIEDIDAAKKAAFDPYEANRNFYIQLRQSKINK